MTPEEISLLETDLVIQTAADKHVSVSPAELILFLLKVDDSADTPEDLEAFHIHQIEQTQALRLFEAMIEQNPELAAAVHDYTEEKCAELSAEHDAFFYDLNYWFMKTTVTSAAPESDPDFPDVNHVLKYADVIVGIINNESHFEKLRELIARNPQKLAAEEALDRLIDTAEDNGFGGGCRDLVSVVGIMKAANPELDIDIHARATLKAKDEACEDTPEADAQPVHE